MSKRPIIFMHLKRLFSLTGCLSLAISCLPAPLQAAPESAVPASEADLMHRMDDAFVRVFEKVAPSVVIIRGNHKPEEDSGSGGGMDDLRDLLSPNPSNRRLGPGRQFKLPQPQGESRSEGSGFIVRADGFILTNNHVIEKCDEIDVQLKDGRHFKAKVQGRDDKTDIAVLKIDAANLPVAELHDSDKIRVGQMCFAIGIPYDMDYSFCAGHISAKGRGSERGNIPDGEPNKVTYKDYLQTDAFINPGNSGGPLFDVDGKVLGMNTLINGMSRNLAFAIPSNMLQEVGDQLIATGKIIRPWLGLRIETLGPESELRDQIKGVSKGVVVRTIEPETPAYNSDLRPADVVTQVDGVAVATAHELQKEVLKKKVGQTLELAVWRNGKELKVKVTTGEMPGDDAQLAAAGAPKLRNSGSDQDNFGLQLQDVTKGLAEKLKLKAQSGALVTNVSPGSPAAESDLHREDVITEVDQKSVANAEQCRKLIAEADTKKGAILFIDRKGQKTYTVLKAQKPNSGEKSSDE